MSAAPPSSSSATSSSSAGHQLTIAEPPGGFDVAIELRPNENIDASEFESAFRTDLKQTWLSKRPAAWLLVAIVLIVGVVLPVSVIVMHRAEQEVPRVGAGR